MQQFSFVEYLKQLSEDLKEKSTQALIQHDAKLHDALINQYVRTLDEIDLWLVALSRKIA